MQPDYDVFEVTQAIQTLKEYLDEKDVEVKNLEENLAHQMEDIAHRSAKDQIQIPKELSNAVRVIVDRIEVLEKKQQEAKGLLQTYKNELRISMMQLLCGGIAGATARTIVSPIDRVKLIIQTSWLTKGEKSKSIIATFKQVLNEEGGLALWKGNLTNCIRIFPYAAIQFGSYERFKSIVMEWAQSRERSFGNFERLCAGGLAGATAATLTYPLDVMRLRQAVYKDIRGPMGAIQNIYREGGMAAFYKGWVPTVVSLAPFIGLNFAAFDYLKATFIPSGNTRDANPLLVLCLGGGAGIMAQSVCYPLDTIRRRMQLKGEIYNGMLDAVMKISKQEGIMGFYNGIVANAAKIIPNNGIRFFVYSHLTSYLHVPKKSGGGGD